jgi:glycosyltransferase involved in cell wall biosynthesis
MLKIAIIAKFPIHYHAPLYKEIGKLHNIENVVLFCDDSRVKPVYVDDFKTTINWDVPLIDGYSYKFLRNYSRKVIKGFFSYINPGLLIDIFKNKYDVIIIQGYDNLSCWLALFAAKLARIKVIWRGEATLRGNENSYFWKKFLKKIVLSRFFNVFNAVMYSCSGNKNYLKFYGVSESKLFPIPCAVNNSFFQSERMKYLGKENKIRKELGIREDDFVVLFSARFVSLKRPLDLLKAIKQINHNNILVLFVGDGPERVTMEKFTKNYRIKALFAGFVNQSELSRYYSISDVAVIVSDYDPSPKVMNESMNFELPIIVTDIVGTAHDLVKDGANGFIIEIGDIRTIAAKIDYLNKNRLIAKAMGKRSLDIVESWNFQEDVKGLKKAIQFVMGY